MMRSIAAILMSSLLAATFSCSQQSSQSIVISGQLESEAFNQIYLVKSSDTQDFKHFYQALDSVELDSLGLFSFSILADSADFYQLRNKDGLNIFAKKNFYLGGGDSLQLLQTKEGIELEGNVAHLHKLQWEMTEQLFGNPEAVKVYKKRAELDPPAFESYINGLKADQNNLVKEYAKTSSLPVRYQSYLDAQIHNRWVKDYWYYMKYHRYYAHGVWEHLPIDSMNQSFLVEWEPDTNFHFLQEYKLGIEGYITYLNETKNKGQSDSLKWANTVQDKFSLIKENLKGVNRDIALMMISTKFGLHVEKGGFFENAGLMNDYFLAHKSSDRYLDLFAENYNAFLKIAPGMPAPEFSLPDKSGELVSLSQFKGKVVYIDFWGTWCGPCIKALPKHQELQDQLVDRDDVVFLNIALEYSKNDIKRWEKFLADRDWSGIHLVAEKQFLNEQLQAYKLNSAPSYILVDKEGNISYPRACGPDRIMDDIRQLL